MRPVPAYRPNLEGKADPAVVRAIEHILNVVYGKDGLSPTVARLNRAGFVTRSEAHEALGPLATRRALSIGGSHPQNVAGLIGQLAQGQLTDVVKVSNLPPGSSPLAQDGNIVELTTTGAKWIWRDGPPPGWQLFLNAAGGGTVTSFSAGNFSPFFTTSVATPSTTPALTFNAIAAANGQLPIGNGAGFVANTLTAGTGISITNGAGTITVANSYSFADQETPTGTVNGVNTVFTLAHSPNPAASLMLFKDRLIQKGGGTDYTLAGNTITFVVAPATSVLCWYRF